MKHHNIRPITKRRNHHESPWSVPNTLSFCSAVVLVACFMGCPSETDDGADGGNTEAALDAGHEDLSDGGQTADGGQPVSCVYDAENTLGDLALGSGFSLVETAIITNDISALAFAGESGDTVYALNAVDNQVLDLGAWDELVSAGNMDMAEPAFDLLRAEDASEIAFASPFLASNGRFLAAGYTLAFDANTGLAPGHIALFDSQSEMTPNPPAHVPSDNNFHAAFLDATLLVNAGNLAGLGSGNGVYAWEAETNLALGQVASFPGGASASGFTAVSQGEAVGLGYYNSSYVNQMSVVSRAELLAAISEMQPVDLEDAESLTSSGFLVAGHMGDDLVLANGYYDANFELVQEDVVAFSTQPETVDGGVNLSVGEPQTVLDAPENTCQRVVFLSSLEDDLIVAVADEHPTHLRLLRISGD